MNLFKDTDSKLTGLEQLQNLIASRQRPPMYATLDFDLVEVEHGRAILQGCPGSHVQNLLGTVHGGYAAAILDSACGSAVHASLAADQAYTTVELSVKYHRPITDETGALRAEGSVTTLGRRIAFAEARLTGSGGTVYATASSTALLFQRPRHAD